jgi:hypothetical protein
MNRTFQSGASMTEFIIAMPLFILFIFVIAELALMYQAKSIVDMAALAAARTGAINNADKSSMEKAAAVALTPLYTHKTETEGEETEGAKWKFDLLKGAEKSVEDSSGSTRYSATWDDGTSYSPSESEEKVVQVEILSPTSAIAEPFSMKRGDERVVPNDSLMYRKTMEYSGVNIQDVNLLKIKLTYLYETKMPFVHYFFAPFTEANLTRTLFTEEPPRVSPDSSPEPVEDGRGARVPLVSYAIVRMQSDIKLANLP